MSTHPAVPQSQTVVAPFVGEPRPALVLDQIERRWGSERVLRGASLSIAPATVAWLGGENGAGKTTLLRIVAGLILPNAGSVRVCGLDPKQDRRAYLARLGYVSAGDRGLYARLTVRKNLGFWAGIAQVPPGRKRELTDAAIARFGLDSLAERRVDRISTGQRQRVRLAMGFLHEPALVLLDEPSASLDDTAIGFLDEALLELALRGGSALWCSPSGAQLAVRADVRYRLEAGRVIEA